MGAHSQRRAGRTPGKEAGHSLAAEAQCNPAARGKHHDEKGQNLFFRPGHIPAPPEPFPALGLQLLFEPLQIPARLMVEVDQRLLCLIDL